MKIEVDYGGKNYGNGSNAYKYKLKISESINKKDLEIKVTFSKYESGQSDESLVKGGRLRLPKRQAAILASALLWAIQQSEIQPEKASIEIDLDEKDFLSLSNNLITVYSLAFSLGVSHKRVLEEAKALNKDVLNYDSYLSRGEAEKIKEIINKKR